MASFRMKTLDIQQENADKSSDTKGPTISITRTKRKSSQSHSAKQASVTVQTTEPQNVKSPLLEVKTVNELMEQQKRRKSSSSSVKKLEKSSSTMSAPADVKADDSEENSSSFSSVDPHGPGRATIDSVMIREGYLNFGYGGDSRQHSIDFAGETVEDGATLSERRQLFFDDGFRRIDYVLVYPDDSSDEVIHTRQLFQENLKRNGLEIEIEPKENSPNNNNFFAKLHVPWEVCALYAERMRMKMPLKEAKEEGEGDAESEHSKFCCECNWLKSFLRSSATAFKLSNPKLAANKFHDHNCYTAHFTRDKMEFFDIKDQTTFFSSAERSRIAHRIMSESYFGEANNSIGIDRLLLKNVYSAAFPLHDGPYRRKNEEMSRDENTRRTLYWEWARWGRCSKFQPLALVRYYFGDKIGLYFAWLGFYTTALSIPSFVGLVCFLYSIIRVWSYPPAQEICDETYPTYVGNFTMCPLCDNQCTYWKLHSSCLYARVTSIFDNESTIFFAVFMSLWATMFLEFWKRRQFELSYEWDLVDYDEERDMVRPEYEAHVTSRKLNPINRSMEPYLDPVAKFSRSTFSVVTVMFWVAVVIAAVFAVTVFRLALHAVFAATVDFSTLGTIGNFASPSVLTTITASTLSVLIILILNWVYEKVALWLTYLELPRTQLEFEDSFALKMFCFQFVNYYSYPLYIAFFKNSFAGYPGNYTYLSGKWRWEQCDVGGCMYELTLQIFLIMFAKQMWNNILELLFPWISNTINIWLSKRGSRRDSAHEYLRWHQDNDLYPLEKLDLFYEYLELLIQYGFVTLFVVAFPLAPLLAFLNNILEIRVDAHKFICQYRRPLAQKASAIGVWYYLLDFMGTLAVVTNAFTIAITSETIPKLVYYYTLSADRFDGNTLNGFTEDSLSIFNVSDFPPRNIPNNPNPFPNENVQICRYRDYRNPPWVEPKYAFTQMYWRTQAARLAFVIVLEHVVFFLKKFLDWLIPDRSRKLKDKIKREHYLVQNMLLKAEKDKFRKELEETMSRRNKRFTPARFLPKRSFKLFESKKTET